MSKILKRFGAYLIDVMVLTIVVSALSMVDFINPYYNKYNEKYDEYVELYDSYQDKKISEEEYIKEYKEINYELDKYSLYSSIIYIVVYLLYFGGFNYITKGQTLGKKILGLRIVDNSDKKSNPSIVKYLIRTLILYGLIFKIPLLILVNVLDVNSYSVVYNVIYYLQYMLELLIGVMAVIRIDGRSFHDMIVGTIVMENKEIEEEVVSGEKVIEAEYKEIEK